MQPTSKVKQNSVNGKVLGISFLILIVGTCLGAYFALAKQFAADNEWSGPVVTLITPTPSPFSSPLVTSTPAVVIAPSSKTLPPTAFFAVPYTVQAPFAVWDAVHEDACEEASFLMIKHFLMGTSFSSKESADTEIKEMVAYGEKNGYGPSITLQQLNDIAKAHYGLSNGVVKTGITNQDIKAEIAAGHPVIVGMAGKLLHNPNFKSGGPIYHMLVVKGYNQTGFITNDPGISQGEGYRYSYEVFANATHDWDPSEITNGQKAYLVFK